MTGHAFALAMADLGVNGPEDERLDWDTVNWRAQEEHVRRLRRRIFKATQARDWAKVRSLQKLMLRSRANTLTSVRRVTQVNAGRKTAGVDGEVALTSTARADLAATAERTRRPPDADQECVGARVGSPLRAQIVWVSAGPQLPGRDRGHLLDAERQARQAPKEVFAQLDHHLWRVTYKWALRAHPNKSKTWVINQYFGRFNQSRNDRWIFGDRDSGAYMVRFVWTKIVRHQMVTGTASPDDPALSDYWAKRRSRKPLPLDKLTLGLARKQRGLCPLCQERLLHADAQPDSPQGWEAWQAAPPPPRSPRGHQG